MSDFFDLKPEQQAERLRQAGTDALDHWGLPGADLELIKYRENAVFRVERDGELFAFRIHRHGYHTDAELRSELQWMSALADAGIHVPRALPADNGEFFITVEAPGLPGALQMDLFEWIRGAPLGSVEAGIADAASVPATYRTIGELAAQVHNQAAGWRPPYGFTRHAWDADGLAGNDPFWGRFWELAAAGREQQDLLCRGRDRIYRELGALAKDSSRYSMIHADFAPENLMVDGDTVRLIDFDDAGFGWHLFELATSLYFILDEPYFEAAKQALIDGYRQHRAMPDAELERLPLFFVARGFTYLGWVHTRQETETARELTPMLLEAACGLAEDYLRA